MSVPHALLALLSDGPRYGLQLQQDFEARTGEVWPLNPGQVYSTLQRLERDGLVQPEDRDGPGVQKSYRITRDGEHELTTWLRTPPHDTAPPRNELVMKVLVALEVPGRHVREVIQAHRHHLVLQMQHYTRAKTDTADDVEFNLVVDAEIYRLEAMVRWLDTADVRLRDTSGGRPSERTPMTPSPVEETRR